MKCKCIRPFNVRNMVLRAFHRVPSLDSGVNDLGALLGRWLIRGRVLPINPRCLFRLGGAGFLLISGCVWRSVPAEEAVLERVIPAGNGVTDALNDYLYQNSVAQDNSYVASYIDLDNDQVDDALVLMQGLDWCSIRGCTLLVFRGLPGGQYFEFISSIEKVREPIWVSDERSEGWRDLVVSTQNKRQFQDVKLGFDGRQYPQSAIAGTALPALSDIAGDKVF